MTSNTPSKEPDPLFRQIQVPAGTSGRERTGKGEGKTVASNETTMALLKQTATSGISAREIYVERIEHKPLSLLPNDSIDLREQRRLKRLQGLKRKRKPKPLSAKEKRELRIYDLPKTLSYEGIKRLNELWNNYISEVLPPSSQEPTSSFAGPLLLKADYHGAFMTIEDCRCASRIGISGICVKETKNMFEIVTVKDHVVKIPKEKSLFRVKTRLGGEKEVEWRLWGDQFLVRSGERSAKKFSGKIIRGKALLEL